MPIPFLADIDLNLNQLLNAVAEKLSSDPGSPVVGQIWYNTTTNKLKKYDGTAVRILYSEADAATANTASKLVLRDSNGDFAAHDIAANKVTGLAAPSADSDAASKGYVDSAINGLDWHASVRVATTADINLSSAPATIDSVTLANGERVLVKNQATGSQNGLYVFNGASSAMTRSTDANASAEITSGLAIWVSEGATNADTGWVLSTDDPITLDTTALTFVQFSSAAIIGGAGLTKTGNTIDVITANSGRIVVNADNIDLASGIATPGTYTSVTVDTYGRTTAGADIVTSNGIVTRTGASTFTNRSIAAGTGITVTNGDGVSGNPSVAIDTAVAVRKYATNIGNGSSTSITVTHNLGTRDVVVSVVEVASPYTHVQATTKSATTNTITLEFAEAPSTDEYRAIVHG